jgi:indolepyruvate ferredoxin oxidoreductase alpha subunit
LKDEAEEYNGFHALYFAALDSDVSLITGVPGYPITSLMELFLEKKDQTCNARWFTNEKVALEIALGASVSGKRTLVLVKHVGMNLLSDPLITSVTHTIGAGLVIIAGDDPGVKGSQNEQDSRWYGRIAEVAVFDPTDPDSAYGSLIRAYELSEETKTPVILRVTAGLEKSKGKIVRLPKASAPHPEFDRSIWKNRMVEKHQLFHSRAYPLLEAEAENTDLNQLRDRKEKRTGEKTEANPENGAIGIVSSGFMSYIVEKLLDKQALKKLNLSEVSHLSLNLVNPLPLGKIGNFLKNNKKVLVIEESEPFIEEHIRISGNVYGKKTGHLPYGQITPEDIEFALENMDEEVISKPEVSAVLEAGNRGRTIICDDCPYLPLYRFLSTLDVRIAGDMGCSVRSAPEPLAAVDVSFALGSAISVACGFEKKGIAVIGDFALAHSGILGLLSAATAGFEVLVLVLQNEVAAMTGGQEVPDLKRVVEAIVPDVSVLEIDATEEKKTDRIENKEKREETGSKKEKMASTPSFSEIIQEKLALPGISVIFIKGKCRKY